MTETCSFYESVKDVLTALVKKDHNCDVAYADLVGGGYLLKYFFKDSWEILVKESDPIEEQTFTIAHELGHLVLGLGGGPLVPVEDGSPIYKFRDWSQEVEDQCDQFARDLLDGLKEGCIHPDGQEYCPREKSWGVFCPLKDPPLQEASP